MTFLDEDEGSGASRSRGSSARRYWWVYALVIVVVVGIIIGVVVASSGDDNGGKVASGNTSSTAAGASDRSGPWKPGSGDLVHGQGTTKDGRACGEDTHQVDGVTYSVPCLPAFKGDNGGATATGITADTIKIVVRKFPSTANQQAADKAAHDAGYATGDDTIAARDQWVQWFNDHYELYGRKVQLVDYTSQFGDGTAEALGGGREGACADATKIAQEMHAFGVISAPTLVGDATSSNGVFSECARRQGLVVFDGAPYYSETYMQEQHPYVWNALMECERIGYQNAEYLGKRIYDRPAKYAKGDLKDKPRKLANYVPDDPQYTHCIGIQNDQLASVYKKAKTMVVTYQLDISRFAEQAQRAIVQFKDAGITSIVLSCDPLSVVFLTQAAKQQNYYPEWISIGVAADDTDTFGRLYDQSVVDGSLFGMSQLGSTSKILGVNSQANKVYHAAFGKDLVKGTTGWYSSLVHLFNLLEAAGPTLTAENMATGAFRLPDLGAPDYAYGRWSFAVSPNGQPGHDHTEVDDSREVYWSSKATSPYDGKTGTYIEVDNGKRYTNGQWPTTDPAVYPNGGS